MLQVKRDVKTKPSMTEKLNERLVDHLMTGIEDITGFHGDYEIREKFSHFNHKVLKPLFIRDHISKRRGQSLVEVYDKLTEKDAFEYIKKNGSFYSSSFSASQSDFHTTMTRTNSLAKFFQDQEQPKSSAEYYVTKDNRLAPPPEGHFLRPPPANGDLYQRQKARDSDTVLDLGAAEVHVGTIHRTDTSMHHLLDEAMFMPRQRFTKRDKYQLPSDDVAQQPYHHRERLKLRKLISKHMKKPTKNGAFANFVKESIIDPKKQKSSEETKEPEADELSEKEDAVPGILPLEIKQNLLAAHKSMPYFSGEHNGGSGDCLHPVGSSLKHSHSPSKPRKSVSFVFAEGEEPEKHAHRLTSRPLKPATDPRHAYSSRKKSLEKDHFPAHFHIEKHDEPESRAKFQLPNDSDSDSDSERGISFTVTPPQEDARTSFNWENLPKSPTRSDKDVESPPPVPTVAETLLPWKRRTTSPPMRRKHEPEDDEAPSLSERAVEPNRDVQVEVVKPVQHPAPSPPGDLLNDRPYVPDAAGEPLAKQPVSMATTAQTGAEPDTKKNEQVQTGKIPQETPLLPFPPSPPDKDEDEKSANEESAILPFPWRSANRGPAELDTHRHSPTDSPPVTFHIPSDESTEEGAVAAAPSDQQTPVSHKKPGFPLPWRQNGGDKPPVRSPSVAHELDSIKPQYSCHSMYMSEAESHHSQPMHYTSPLIHTGSNGPHTSHSSHPQLHSLDPLGGLPEEESDFQVRIENWIRESTPDPRLPVNDTEISDENLEFTSLKHKAPHEPSSCSPHESII